MRTSLLYGSLGFFLSTLAITGCPLARGQVANAPSAESNEHPTTQPTTVKHGHITCTIPPEVELDPKRPNYFSSDFLLPSENVEIGLVVREPVKQDIPENIFVMALKQMYAGLPKEHQRVAPEVVKVAGFDQVVHQRYMNERAGSNEKGGFTDRWDYWRRLDKVNLKGELEVLYDEPFPESKLEDSSKHARKLIEAIMSSAVDDRDTDKAANAPSAGANPTDAKAAGATSQPSANGAPAPPVRSAGASQPDDAARANSLLTLAQSYESIGHFVQARAKYQQILEKYPSTPAATTARKALQTLPATDEQK